MIGQVGSVGIRVDTDQIRHVARGNPRFDIFFDGIANHELHIHVHIRIQPGKFSRNLKHLLWPVRSPDQCGDGGTRRLVRARRSLVALVAPTQRKKNEAGQGRKPGGQLISSHWGSLFRFWVDCLTLSKRRDRPDAPSTKDAQTILKSRCLLSISATDANTLTEASPISRPRSLRSIARLDTARAWTAHRAGLFQ